jgi:F0F1-type ATP synthase assembly protein I
MIIAKMIITIILINIGHAPLAFSGFAPLCAGWITQSQTCVQGALGFALQRR